MGLGLIGKKLGMSQIFDEHGNVVPVTVIKAGPCYVVQKKTADEEGYNAVQIGFDEVIKVKRVNKPDSGHFKKADVTPTHRSSGSSKGDTGRPRGECGGYRLFR